MCEQLSPCPFCGRTKTLRPMVHGSRWRIICREGHCAMGPERKTRTGAIKAWNKLENVILWRACKNLENIYYGNGSKNV